MPEIKDYREEQWTLAGDGQQWIVTESGFIDTADTYGIANLADNSDIRVNGLIRSSGDEGHSGIALGDASSVAIGNEGWISGFQYGVTLSGASEVVNEGVIYADYAGVISEERGSFVNLGGIVQGTLFGVGMGLNGQLENSGLIRGLGEAGVAITNTGTVIDNQAGGRISGGTFGIFVQDTISVPAADSRITNAGTIRSLEEVAIQCEDDTSITLVNTGRIIGDVILGDLGNTVDTRGGVVRGTITGGDAADIYKISSSKVDIQDWGSATGDKVISTASYTLVGGLDDLELRGSANANGVGNVGHNRLIGNSGKNRLEGLDGDDVINGGRGNDVLFGGAGIDQFNFVRGDGADRIDDLELTDFIETSYVGTARDFRHLDMKQAGDDVVIDFGHGDRLRLVDFEREDLSFNMFDRPT